MFSPELELRTWNWRVILAALLICYAKAGSIPEDGAAEQLLLLPYHMRDPSQVA